MSTIVTTYNDVIINEINNNILSFFFNSKEYTEQVLITFQRKDIIEFDYSYDNASITIKHNNHNIKVQKLSELYNNENDETIDFIKGDYFVIRNPNATNVLPVYGIAAEKFTSQDKNIKAVVLIVDGDIAMSIHNQLHYITPEIDDEISMADMNEIDFINNILANNGVYFNDGKLEKIHKNK